MITKKERMVISKLLAILIVTATVYNAVPEQTDSSPFITASIDFLVENTRRLGKWKGVKIKLIS